MLKLTKTGIGLLTKQYRSVLKKCLLLNLGLFMTTIFLTKLLFTNSFAENTYVTSWSTYYSMPNGLFLVDGSSGVTLAGLFNDFSGSNVYIEDGRYVGTAVLEFYYRGAGVTRLASDSFKLNGSSSATGIDFAANVTADTTKASHLATTGAVNQLLNYYYTFRVDERA